MKINLELVLLAIDAALAAFILAHLPLELAISILFVAGFAAIVFNDYGRRLPRLTRRAETPLPDRGGENLPLAS
jgi:hypothetical protein